VAQAKSGKIRALAVTSPQRMPAAPQIPALAETLPGFNAAPNVFLVAPAGATAGVVQRVSAALRAALGTAEVRESLAKQGATPMSLAPRELGAQIADEMKRWAAVVKHAGVKLD
jgi:tripartite-type tricarboxylate transporter receptor subunit TctC